MLILDYSAQTEETREVHSFTGVVVIVSLGRLR